MEKDGSNLPMRLLYGNPVGRFTVKAMLVLKVPKVMAWYLHTPFSKGMIRRYIRKYNISMKGYPHVGYRNFSDFFERRRLRNRFDGDPEHFISPCDGMLSVYPVTDKAVFPVKGSEYRICDLIGDAELADRFRGGLGLIFRLAPNDYHHYAVVDDGYMHEHHFIEGQLHSVQPIACENVPVYRLNRRCWTLLETEHFGPAVQIEVGALAVGGIVNEIENTPVQKGQTMGHFSLCGSTIVMFVAKDRIALLPEIAELIGTGIEYKVNLGDCVGVRKMQ